MITVFIIASLDTKPLVRTLNALIAATVEGLVREVVIIAETGNDEVAKLANDAGCDFVSSTDFPAAVQTCKGNWLMILESGALPEQGWAEAVGNHVQSNESAARFKRSPLAQRSFLQRLFHSERPLALGLLVQKNAALGLGQAALATPEILVKAAKPKPLSAALRPA